jgi:DNA-binding XRE family transcriptional regulator
MEKKRSITIEISEETYDKVLSLVHVINYLNRNVDNEITPERFLKGSLAYYMERFYGLVEQDYENPSLLNIGNPHLPLKIDIEKHVQKLGLPLTHIAKQINISKATLNSIIESKHQPSLDIFIRLWVLIGCPPLHEILYREKENDSND